MVAITSFVSFFALASAAVMAANEDVTFTVKNNCKVRLQVNELGNNHPEGKTHNLPAGRKLKFKVPYNWGGRIWARENCSGKSDCLPGEPASLAELQLGGWGGMDFYDVSFVDGFNFPMTLKPDNKKADKYNCGAPSCKKLPSCPKEFRNVDKKGKYIGCKSACAAYGKDEDCCGGEYLSRDLCKPTKSSTHVKDACPDVYSYAYDDSTSTFTCVGPKGYTITFC